MSNTSPKMSIKETDEEDGIQGLDPCKELAIGEYTSLKGAPSPKFK